MEYGIKRSKMAVFLNTTPSSTATYKKVAKGVTDLQIAYNPQTKSEQYIDEDTATTYTTSYQPTISNTMTAYKGNEVFEYLNELRVKRPVFGESDTDILIVDIFDYTGEEGSESYSAEKQNVNIGIESYGGAAEDALQIEYSINFVGNATKGTVTFDSSTGVPTFTANS